MKTQLKIKFLFYKKQKFQVLYLLAQFNKKKNLKRYIDTLALKESGRKRKKLTQKAKN
jgi:hypothetical protein